MKYITLFETDAAYKAATLDLPNVSLIEETMSVGYKPYVPETRVVAKYNITSTSSPAVLRTSYEQNVFKSMEIDGVMLDELVTEYTFDTVGVHTVKYELYDETKLGSSAPVFNTNNLIECIIPNSVTSISNLAFYECTSLTRLNSDADGVFNLPSGITSIGQAAFFKCENLTSIDIPDGIISIGNGAFQGCNKLTSCTIGNGVTSIGNQAFSGCYNLTSVTIGNSVTSIDTSAFGGCYNLTSIISNAMTAPTISNTTFQGVKTGGTLTVPSGSSGYDVWMGTSDYYLGSYNWTKVEQ